MSDKKDEGLRLLKDIRRIEHLIETLTEDIERTYSMLTSTTVKPKELNVQSSGESDPMSSRIITVLEYKEKLEEHISNLCAKKNLALDILKQMDSEQQIMLTLRYIEGKTIEEVSEELNRSSYYHTWEVLHKAEEQFCEIYASGYTRV